MTNESVLPKRAPWTLRRRLVVGVAGLVTMVLTTVGVISIVTLSASVTTVVDTQLAGSMSSFSHLVHKFRDGPRAAGSESAAGPEKPLTDFIGQSPGCLIAIVSGGEVVDSAIFGDADPKTLGAGVTSQLEAMTWSDGERRTVDLVGLGSYRVESQIEDNGDVLIAAASLAAVDAAVMQEALFIAILALVAIAIAVAGTIVVVRLALRPLSRVVHTASAVTSIPLDRGEVAALPRLSHAETDPRTEVGKVGEALNQMLAHVDGALAVRAQTDRRMRQFITDASHELRTPLAAIQGYAELTRQESDALPDMSEYALGRIEAEASRMGSLVSDLLLLARLDEGQDLHVDAVDLSDVVANAVNDSKASAPDHEWVLDVPDETVVVIGDSERLQQVALNLLSNARLHTPPGTRVTGRLTVLPGDDGGAAVELSVSDDGPGIDHELLPELFQRFARGDKARVRDSGSTGLGLAIVASIVEAHYGSIEVDSTARGTTFRVIIPGVVTARSAEGGLTAGQEAAPISTV